MLLTNKVFEMTFKDYAIHIEIMVLRKISMEITTYLLTNFPNDF